MIQAQYFRNSTQFFNLSEFKIEHFFLWFFFYSSLAAYTVLWGIEKTISWCKTKNWENIHNSWIGRILSDIIMILLWICLRQWLTKWKLKLQLLVQAKSEIKYSQWLFQSRTAQYLLATVACARHWEEYGNDHTELCSIHSLWYRSFLTSSGLGCFQV